MTHTERCARFGLYGFLVATGLCGLAVIEGSRPLVMIASEVYQVCVGMWLGVLLMGRAVSKDMAKGMLR